MTATLLPSKTSAATCCASDPPAAPNHKGVQVALVGNPNAGKTTLFNALTGIRAKTANFPGTTLEVRRGAMRVPDGGAVIELIDLPGIYSLQNAAAEEKVAIDKLLGRDPGHPGPKALILLLDATNLVRNLFLASQVLELGLPTVAVLTMVDVADSRGLKIDQPALADALGCPVISVTAKTKRGIPELRRAIGDLLKPAEAGATFAEALPRCEPDDDHLRYDWAESVGRRSLAARGSNLHDRTENIDRILTDRVWGLVSFLAIMLVVFYLIFAVAQIPMGWIEDAIGGLGALATRWIPEGDLQSLVVNGAISGVGGVLVFLPQICLIFFCLTMLEDVGYMARAALVMDRLMRHVGLPGKAFVPMLSAHACAIPAIMSTRVIDNRRDRLVTIMILPLLTCSARLPVYAMVTALLFPSSPLKAALTFMGAYGLGLLMAIATALLIQRTILPGKTAPLVIELPDFRRPAMRQALLTTYDRARIFLAKAGTNILAISIVLWFLATYPQLNIEKVPPADRAQIAQLQTQAAQLQAAGDLEKGDAAKAEADNLIGHYSLANSYSGKLGRFVEPVIRPLGFDWQIGVGVISSFAAREVVVSTFSILYGIGADGDRDALYDRMRAARHPDGSPVFTLPACMSLLVFFVLAMQCLPTQVVARRETGNWGWPILQFGYMTVLAYGSAFITYQGLTALGIH